MKRKLLASKELVVFLITERSYRICRDFRCTDGLACLSSRYACGGLGVCRLGESETTLFLCATSHGKEKEYGVQISEIIDYGQSNEGWQ